jgi:hypothetical protein
MSSGEVRVGVGVDYKFDEIKIPMNDMPDELVIGRFLSSVIYPDGISTP